jgi:exoribonuclease R
MYKININNRCYNSYKIFLQSTLEEVVDVKFDNILLNVKLFDGDVFNYDDNEKKFSIIHSSVRIIEHIPCVLILQNNNTYGRKNNKLLYKCVPDDFRIPEFLVPYEIKEMGFSKIFYNLYVTICFKEWESKNPIGSLKQVIGSINELNNFYEYQLYCKSLHNSIQKFTREATKALRENDILDYEKHNLFIENICKVHTNIENRLNQEWNIITIDPNGSTDYDDGYSLIEIDHNKKMLSIYISNVTIWMDVLNLWDSFSRRIMTIYLPDRKRPMLPTILSDCLCSLLENKNRIAFVMDIMIENNEIKEINYVNALIRVSKNYSYEQDELLKNDYYVKMLDVVKKMSKTYKYAQYVRNSREFVSYLMIFMNVYCAKEFMNSGNGLFRSNIINNNNNDIIQNVPNDVIHFIKSWTQSTSYYVSFDESVILKHDMMEMESYTHITSPIRRLIDLLNIIQFQKNKNMINLSSNAFKFYNKWLKELDYINISMRAVRKVQIECNMLEMCMHNPDFLDKIYEGYCFDKIVRNDGLYQFIVFLPELKLVSKITIRKNLNNYDKCNYKLYLFNNEVKFKKKIRLQLLE